MRRLTTLTMLCFSIAFLIYILPTGSVSAAENQNKSVFIDLDGDGFNDNDQDADGDGIPDAADPDSKPQGSDKTESADLINFASGLGPAEIPEDMLRASDGFSSNQFNARSLSENRCGFTSEEGFGSGTGVGINDISGGGGCVGGVCH